MFKQVVEFMKRVEAIIKRMSPRAAFAFALSCTERQWPVFERALESEPELSIDRAVFRRAIDSSWEYCLHNTTTTNDLLDTCRSRLPEEAANAFAATVQTISNSIVDLLNAIQRNDPAYSYHLSGRNLGLIELLLDEQGVLLDNLTDHEELDSEEVKQIRHLAQGEIEHQEKDLQRLIASDSIATIEAIKNESIGKSLFEGVWFS